MTLAPSKQRRQSFKLPRLLVWRNSPCHYLHVEQLTEGERERLESWALLSQIARQRGAGSALPGNFPPDIEAEYQRLRAEFDSLRKQIENDIVDRPAHERFRDEARTLLRRLAESPSS